MEKRKGEKTRTDERGKAGGTGEARWTGDRVDRGNK